MSEPALSALRESLDGCETALLIDLEARTCLTSSSRVAPSQDQLDHLCDVGAACLDLSADHDKGLCIVSNPVSLRVFTRLRPTQPEALCLIFDPMASLDGIGARIFAVLQADQFGASLD